MDSKFELYPHQVRALSKIAKGSILNGEVGSGKTFTALAFYLKEYSHRDLYVITTAKKRDSKDWETEADIIGVDSLVVDSWNNISEYIHLSNAFFIFDEQRVVGYGKWSKSFIEIARRNAWILLSATPGDNWMDYMPVFIANGFYKNKTDFTNQHVEYNPYVKFPQIKKFHDIQKLERYRSNLLVEMDFTRHTIRHDEIVECNFDRNLYFKVSKKRWNVFEDKPIENVAEYVQCLRRAVGTSQDRLNKAKFVMSSTQKIIVFYNYNYELDLLREICEEGEHPYAEWNGKRHQQIPETNHWVYLVQYTAGAEGWNCVDTDTILFYSPNYSYKIVEQSKGRIDRINTEFVDLHYIFLTTMSDIDKSVFNALNTKIKFNEKRWGDRRYEGK